MPYERARSAQRLMTILHDDATGEAHLYFDAAGQQSPSHHFPVPVEPALTQTLGANGYNAHERAVPVLPVGHFYGRMWRGPTPAPTPSIAQAGLAAPAASSARSLTLLSGRLESIFAHIEPTQHHVDVYSYELRHLLILACTEVEAAWKAIMLAQGAVPQRPPHFNRGDYVRLARPMRLEEWRVRLALHPSYTAVTPFAGWSGPGHPLPWYDDYNAVKHDRETNLTRARFQSVVTAMAASYVMHAAQFGPEELPAKSEFQIDAVPTWPVAELYLDPFLRHPTQGGITLGNGTWIAAQHPL